MSMFSKLFRPGRQQTHGRFTTAFVNGTAVYGGDLVCWDTLAPSSQGASGVVDGKTLTATDYVFVQLPPAAAAAADGLQAGIVIGNDRGLGRTPGATAMTNDKLAVIQTWGVCPDVYAVTSTDSAAGILCTTGATTGAVTQVLATAAEGTTVGDSVTVVGFGLNAQATDHVRATVSTEPGLDVFVRCDF